MSDVVVAGHICLDIIPEFYNSNKPIDDCKLWNFMTAKCYKIVQGKNYEREEPCIPVFNFLWLHSRNCIKACE